MQSFKDLFNHNKWAILFAVSAIVAVLLFVLLRWWAFLVIPVLAIAVFFGHLMDKGGTEAVKDFFGKLFSRRK